MALATLLMSTVLSDSDARQERDASRENLIGEGKYFDSTRFDHIPQRRKLHSKPNPSLVSMTSAWIVPNVSCDDRLLRDPPAPQNSLSPLFLNLVDGVPTSPLWLLRPRAHAVLVDTRPSEGKVERDGANVACN